MWNWVSRNVAVMNARDAWPLGNEYLSTETVIISSMFSAGRWRRTTAFVGPITRTSNTSTAHSKTKICRSCYVANVVITTTQMQGNNQWWTNPNCECDWDLNRDLNTSRNLIWTIKIWFKRSRFDLKYLRFDLKRNSIAQIFFCTCGTIVRAHKMTGCTTRRSTFASDAV